MSKHDQQTEQEKVLRRKQKSEFNSVYEQLQFISKKLNLMLRKTNNGIDNLFEMTRNAWGKAL